MYGFCFPDKIKIKKKNLFFYFRFVDIDYGLPIYSAYNNSTTIHRMYNMYICNNKLYSMSLH